jgi:PPM family protein phosphatase
VGLITTHSARTDLGRKRTLNEDSYVVAAEHGLFVVADGMGGHAAGEVASAMAVETMGQFFQATNSGEEITWPFEIDENLPIQANKLKTAIRLANRRIHQSAIEQHRLEGMGTTIVGVVVVPDQNIACIGHVGDSRAYLVREGELWSLTTDHSWVNVQVMLGQITEEEARYHPMKNIITRALGTKEDVEVDISVRELYPGDYILLCSDGLSGMIEEKEILQCVLSRKDDLEKATEDLIRRANAHGGDDNITVILLHFQTDDIHEMSTIRVDSVAMPATSHTTPPDTVGMPTVKMSQYSADPLKRAQDPLLGAMDNWEADLETPAKPLKPIQVEQDDDLDIDL